MLRFVFLAVLVAAATAEEAVRSHGGNEGWSSQYHYASSPYGGVYSGLSFDLSTGLFLAGGAIILLLALAAIVYPAVGHGGGWGRAYSGFSAEKASALAEKVMNGLEKAYELYNKSQ